jgi:hypothetical protein
MPSPALPRVLILTISVLSATAVPVAAAPGQATLVSPTGEVTGSTIVFSWNAVAGSTWYLFWIGSTTGQPTLQQWYTAEQAHCANGGTCTITLTIGAAPGAYQWYIQTWNTTGAGPWSRGNAISLNTPPPTWSRKLPVNQRYTVVLNGVAVLDNETGLTWERNPSPLAINYPTGYFRCNVLTLGGRMGWRLPSVSEILSVTDPFTTEGLPPGHPFSVGSAPQFWTNTTPPQDPSSRIVITINSLSSYSHQQLGELKRAWCVRGPASGPTQS